MNLSVSPQMRVVALAGLLAALCLALAVFMLGRRHGSTSSPTPSASASTHVTPHVRPHTKAAAAPSRPAVRPTPAATRKPRPLSRPAVPATVRAALAAGWPKPIAKAFAHSKVVVAVVYSSESALDRDALAEATAAAAQLGAAVVSLDVSSNADSATRQVLEKIGMLDSPATLVLRRPGTLFVQLDGYSDKATVAQAVANAAFPA
jgi:hypothetical protein